MVARLQRAVHDAEITDDAAERVENGVKYQSLQRRIGVALGSGDTVNDGIKYLRHTHARLGRTTQDILVLATQEVNNLVGHLFGHCAIKVYLVHHRDNLQVVLKRQIEVRYRLRLYALGGIDNKKSALACSDGSGNLVAEVHMPRSVNKVQGEVLACVSRIPPCGDAVVHLDGVALDCDATLFLQFHVVKHLILHITLADGVCHLQQTVGQSTLTVVNMSYYAEITYILHRCKDTLFSRYTATITAFRVLPARSMPQHGWCMWRHSRCPLSSCVPASR